MSYAFLQYETWEHKRLVITKESFSDYLNIKPKPFGQKKGCYAYHCSHTETEANIEAGYYIGVDWLVEEKVSIVVSPKLDISLAAAQKDKAENSDIEVEEGAVEQSDPVNPPTVNYFALLKACLVTDYLYKEIDDLVQIDWKAKEIPIPQSQDWLSPLLIVKFLNVLKSIVRKGLKKGYYPVTQNLSGKIKGKILVGQNIKQNVVKNRFANIICQYEEYSIDTAENRLLHKAFRFATSYLENYSQVYKGSSQPFEDLVNYCRPAFERVRSNIAVSEIKQFKPNTFFKEYSEGIHLAKLILKRYGYNISNTTLQNVSTPPYWIDMPKLFELYVYQFLKAKFPAKDAVQYQFSTYGNVLDFLINDGSTRMVVDAKYKPLYNYGVNHQDIRQVSGYARLEKVYSDLKVNDAQIIRCLIVYPDMSSGHDATSFKTLDLADESFKIKAYREVFKIGIILPCDVNLKF